MAIWPKNAGRRRKRKLGNVSNVTKKDIVKNCKGKQSMKK